MIDRLKKYWWLCLLLAVLAAGVWLWLWPDGQKPVPASPAALAPAALSASEAYALALSAAKAWDSGASLAQMSSSAEGGNEGWQLLFVSPNRPGRGYQATVLERRLAGGEEVPFSGAGAAVPADLPPAEAAVAQLRSIKGYETAAVAGVELIYGPDGQAWYWAIKTDKGTVTIKAK